MVLEKFPALKLAGAAGAAAHHLGMLFKHQKMVDAGHKLNMRNLGAEDLASAEGDEMPNIYITGDITSSVQNDPPKQAEPQPKPKSSLAGRAGWAVAAAALLFGAGGTGLGVWNYLNPNPPAMQWDYYEVKVWGKGRAVPDGWTRGTPPGSEPQPLPADEYIYRPTKKEGK